MNLIKLHQILILFCLPFLAHSATSAPDGEALYSENCSICHGSDGTGGVGIPLALPDFINQAPDEYLKRTIRFGRPGRVMPAFDKLSDSEINAIVAHIRNWSDKRAPAWDETPVAGNKQHGQKLFDQHCITCHGKNATGGTGTGVSFSRQKDLPITAPALNNPGFLSSASDLMIKNIILNGRNNTPMQAASTFGLKDLDVNDIVSYIRSLQPPLHSTPPKPEEEPAALIYESSYGFDETVENVKRAATGMNFRLIRDQALDQGLVEAGKESQKQKIIYFCNFKFLYEALAIDPRVGMFLPCRVTVIEHKDTVQVMSINPKRLSRLFNNNELDNACTQMHELYTSILEEATL